MIAVCEAHDRKSDVRRGTVLRAKVRTRPATRSEGAVGSFYYLRQCEKHSGPHSDWFYDLESIGGGALMDMGCHGFAWFRWMLGAERETAERVRHMQYRAHSPRPHPLRRALGVRSSSSRAARSAWSRTAGPSSAAWRIASRSVGRAA